MRFLLQKDMLIPEQLLGSNVNSSVNSTNSDNSANSNNPIKNSTNPTCNNRLNTKPILQQNIKSINHYKQLPIQSFNESFHYHKKLQTSLAGKQLLIDELPFSIREIHDHYENGFLQYHHGVFIHEKKTICARCGNKDENKFASFSCARCQENCTYCRACIMMGRVSTCTPLVSWIGPPPEWTCPERPLAWTGKLSVGQQVASQQVIGIINDVFQLDDPVYFLEHQLNPITPTILAADNATSEKESKLFLNKNNIIRKKVQQRQDLLLWAVCGAGKTEVLFAGIEQAMSAQKRVCIATPRTDVVIELTPRLQAAFPQINIASLYGGSEDKHEFSPLTIATTHQLFRFYEAFDVVILDEVDAFPYTADTTLQIAVQQARKPQSAMIYLTATPSEKWQRECRQGKRNFVTIPARYHRHPLPVPKFVWCGNWQKRLNKNELPPNILTWIKKRIALKKQALLFFPRIELMDKVLPLLQQIDPNIESVHSEDPDRKDKVQKMRDRKMPLLLTTTILERGVTFPNIDVAIFGAEDGIFTESALVQIAGRVGRSADHPSGDITFFHYGKTEDMVKAKRQILMMNREAKKLRLID